MRSLKNRWRRCQYEGVAKRYGFTLKTPVRELSDEQLHRLLYGSGTERIEYHFKHPRGRWEHRWAEPWRGVIPMEMERYRRVRARGLREKLEDLVEMRALLPQARLQTQVRAFAQRDRQRKTSRGSPWSSIAC